MPPAGPENLLGLIGFCGSGDLTAAQNSLGLPSTTLGREVWLEGRHTGAVGHEGSAYEVGG